MKCKKCGSKVVKYKGESLCVRCPDGGCYTGKDSTKVIIGGCQLSGLCNEESCETCVGFNMFEPKKSTGYSSCLL